MTTASTRSESKSCSIHTSWPMRSADYRMVNIFDEETFTQVVDSKERPAAEPTPSRTRPRGRLRSDGRGPAFYKRFSELIRKVIEDFKAKRISDLEYLNRVRDIRDQMVRRDTAALPEPVRDDPLARAFYGCIHETLRGSCRRRETASTEADQRRCGSKHRRHCQDSHRRVDWTASADVENAIKNDIDDYMFDVIRGEHGVTILPEAINSLFDQLLMVARRQAGMMVRSTSYGSAVIEYGLALSSRRSLSISVLPDGTVAVAAPAGRTSTKSTSG